MKIVINKCYGGFSLSEIACKELGLKSGYDEIARDDKLLVALIEKFGSQKVSGRHAKLSIVDIPDGIDWCIEEYDGKEWVSEKHRSWS